MPAIIKKKKPINLYCYPKDRFSYYESNDSLAQGFNSLCFKEYASNRTVWIEVKPKEL